MYQNQSIKKSNKFLAFCVKIALHFSVRNAQDNFAVKKPQDHRRKKMIKKFSKFISILSLLAILLSSSIIDNDRAASDSQNILPVGSYSFDGPSFTENNDTEQTNKSLNVTTDYKDLKLYVGGMPFGVKFLTKGIVVCGFSDCKGKVNPAKTAGIRPGDIITEINGKEIKSVSELNGAVYGEKALTVKYTRNGQELMADICPIYLETECRYTLGIAVRDSGAGIGTVTFICPKTRAFGGLGHGICESTGELIPMDRGSVVDVKINGIVKGLSGAPGEVKGYFNGGKTGSLIGNSHCGVWGIFAELPSELHGRPVSIGTRDTVRSGKAYIYTMLDGEKVERYEIEISDIQRNAQGNKCFVVRITDKKLLSKTGGIIQGMSGSPIIQNGKLVGAVTHVLINDPTTGYGIFIENMLNQMGDLAG